MSIPSTPRGAHTLPPCAQLRPTLTCPDSRWDPPSPARSHESPGSGEWLGRPRRALGDGVEVGRPFPAPQGAPRDSAAATIRPAPPSPQPPAAGRRPPPRPGVGDPPGAPPTPPTSPARKSCRRHHGAAVSLPVASPTHPRGRGAGTRGSGRRPGPARPGVGRAGGRRAREGRGRSPAALHPTHWPARRGAESLLKPPRLLPSRAGQGAGAGAGRGGRRRHVPPEPVRPHFLSQVPQLGPVPNSALTFPSLVPTLPEPET